MSTFARRFALLFTALAASGIRDAAADPDSQVSATGHSTIVNPTTHNIIEQSFSAIQHHDGTVSGEFETRVTTADGDFVRRAHGDIICLTVTGNIARVGGITTQSSGTGVGPPGTEVFGTAVDNGEGANDPPDLTTIGAGGPPGTALLHCTVGIARPLFPVVDGNIQVRPGGL